MVRDTRAVVAVDRIELRGSVGERRGEPGHRELPRVGGGDLREYSDQDAGDCHDRQGHGYTDQHPRELDQARRLLLLNDRNGREHMDGLVHLRNSLLLFHHAVEQLADCYGGFLGCNRAVKRLILSSSIVPATGLDYMGVHERTGVTVQRTKRSLAAVVMTGVLLGLGAGVSSGAASAAPSDQPSQMTIEGTLPSGTSTQRFASCLGDGYVERGANQTVPHLTVVVYPTVYVGPVVAWGTDPNAFGSRAVTSMTLFIHNVDTDRSQRWAVIYYCTPDKSKAWLVFG